MIDIINCIIPRFISVKNYAENFGLQWNKFKSTQLDSAPGLPLTTKMKPETLLKAIQFYVPIWLPMDTLLRQIPKMGTLVVSLIPIPCWNYLGIGLNKKQRLEWAIMDTFDALGAAYDLPKTLEEVREMVKSAACHQIDVFRGSNGIVANGKK